MDPVESGAPFSESVLQWVVCFVSDLVSAGFARLEETDSQYLHRRLIDRPWVPVRFPGSRLLNCQRSLLPAAAWGPAPLEASCLHKYLRPYGYEYQEDHKISKVLQGKHLGLNPREGGAKLPPSVSDFQDPFDVNPGYISTYVAAPLGEST